MVIPVVEPQVVAVLSEADAAARLTLPSPQPAAAETAAGCSAAAPDITNYHGLLKTNI